VRRRSFRQRRFCFLTGADCLSLAGLRFSPLGQCHDFSTPLCVLFPSEPPAVQVTGPVLGTRERPSLWLTATAARVFNISRASLLISFSFFGLIGWAALRWRIRRNPLSWCCFLFSIACYFYEGPTPAHDPSPFPFQAQLSCTPLHFFFRDDVEIR